MNKETARIEHVSQHSLFMTKANACTIKYSFEIFKRFIKKGKILELGPAEGVMTEKLIELGQDLTIVEGTKTFCDLISRKFPQVRIIHSLFEDFKTEIKYNTIVLGHVLEHVENPVQILSLVKNWLTDDGIILAAVPNSHSLHRQAAVLMGLLDKENSMSELDIHHGHRRVYNIEQFKNDFLQAGLNIKSIGGYWLKPLSNKQIEDTWTPEMMEAFMKLGERYPDIAAEIYIVAGN